MEGSDATQEAVGQAEGVSTFDDVGEHQPTDAPHDPNKAIATSAPPPQSQSGDPLDPATKAGLGLGGQVPNQGESKSVGEGE